MKTVASTARRGRRIGLALLVTATTWGAEMALLSFADDAQAGGPLPDAFVVAKPRAGDAGTYAFRVVETSWSGSRVRVDEPDLVRFEWLTPEDTFDANGTPVRANVVRYDARSLGLGPGRIPVGSAPAAGAGSSGLSDRLLHFDSRDGRLVRGAWWSNQENQYAIRTEGPSGTAVEASTWINATTFHPSNSLFQRDQPNECGLVHALQGTPRPTSDDLLLVRSCVLAGVAVAELVVRADRSERRGDERCVAYAQPAAVDGRRARLLLCPSIPYPVRMTVEADAYGVHMEYELHNFTRGTAAAASAADPPGTPSMPPLTFAATQPYGPDEAGIDHPFPLSRAYAAGVQEAPDVQAWLGNHTDAVLRSARFAQEDTGDRTNRTWTLSFYSTTGGLSVEVRETQAGAGRNVSAAAKPTEGQPAEDQPRWIWPARLPTVASLFERWRSLTGELREPNAWGFTFGHDHHDCVSPYERPAAGPRALPCRVTFLLQVGIDRVEWRADGDRLPAAQAGVRASVRHVLHLSDDGRAIYVEELVRIERHRPASSNFTPDPADGGPAAPAPAMAVAHAPGWIPSKRLVFTGTVALVAGLGVYLAPTLRHAAGFAMFSRLERGSALDHPSRARLAALIEAEPGLHTQELQRRTSLSRRTTEHHLHKLVEAGLVTGQFGNGLTCYFSKGRFDRRLLAVFPHLRAAGARRLLEAVVERPGTTAGAASAAAALDPGTVTYHARRLEALGLVESRRSGRQVHLFPTPLAREALAAFLETSRRSAG